MINVLFVCTGNICRSPTAEGVFRQLVADAGLTAHIRTASAGVESYHVGEPPDARAIEIAAHNDVDISGQRAHAFKPADFTAFEYIYAMDEGHMRILQRRAPAGAKLAMFLEDGDVPDPWYGNMKDFNDVYAMIAERCQQLLAAIVEENNL
ncbi:MAG: low molecular weight phosphotyrosine protein phosphatase [Micavibrio sp.]|nr:low molecular weight phosphotyrosine protein phosphatase [Micavibrio sp.]